MIRAALAAAIALALAGGPAAAQQVLPSPGPQGNEICLKPGEETPEIYGPTDIGATAGNQRMSVAVNPEGTLSVMRWPSPSYWEQLRYTTIDRDLPMLGLDPNEGAFSGLFVRLRDGSERMLWLRELELRQRYASEDSDTVVTRFRERSLRLLLEIDDVVPRNGDVLVRRHVMRLGRGSPVRSARLVAFANLNPTASKRALLPTEDWCEEIGGSDRVRYDAGTDSLVWEIAEIDQSTGIPRSVAVAIGASRQSDGHQAGADGYSGHHSAGGGPQSAYDDAADGTLSGSGSFGPGEADSALSVPIGRKPVNVVFAAAEDAARATSLLGFWRGRDARRAVRAKRRSYLRWMRDAPLPRRAPRALVRLAKRSLVSLRQAIDERAGRAGDKVAIVASIATQSPYGQDWIRDGAFFNEALDVIGHGSLVERHNAFYAEVQKKIEEGAPPGTAATTCQSPTPDGNWFMTNYADGPDAGLFTWEIDEAAFGLWAFWRHYEHDPDRAYLESVYSALRRTAEFLVAFRDPATGLMPPYACEDDNPPREGQPTMHAAGPVLLAMRSAAEAASVLGREADAARYRARADELAAAIDRTYDAGGGAWTSDFGDGGWALWPVRVKTDYGDPRMRAQAALAWERVAPAFLAPDGPRKRGQYEVKALHGLARWHKAVGDATMAANVKRGLRWIAEEQVAWQETGIMGEAWYVRDGEVISVVSQPHVWEQVLVYLAAIDAYGRSRYRAGRPDRLLRPARTRRAP
ncbi:MAG TPA: hypothetical protein VNT32_05920 [Thermoleophilaceae bacterium]|nr:hypothetical protein [Thermoleophilaceae bacterium]